MRLRETFGRRLTAVRIDRGLTLAELAALIGRTKQTICQWERGGTAEIRARDVTKCARALRCRREVLLVSLVEPIPPAPSSWPRTLRRIKKYVAAVTGRKRSSPQRIPTPGPRRPLPLRLHARPAFDQALELLPKLLPAELELLLEMKNAASELTAAANDTVSKKRRTWCLKFEG
jgi:transcriptional regulator with XRE-family HTH domain